MSGAMASGEIDRSSGTSTLAPPLRLAQIIQLLRRHIWLIVICGLLAAGGAFFYVRSLPKTYTATSSISVEGDRFAIPELQGALRADSSPDPMPLVRTEAQALVSRAQVQKVVSQLHLERLPEFNESLRPLTIFGKMRNLLNEWVHVVLPPAPSGATTEAGDEAVLNAAFKALAIFQDNRSLVIQIGFTSRDPHLAAQFVNSLISDYLQVRAIRRDQANQGANQELNQRIDDVRADLANIESQMNDLRTRNSMVGVRAGSVGQQQVEELTSAAARAALERSQLEINYARAVAAQKQGSVDALAAVLNAPTISRLREQVASAAQRVAELSSRYGAGYPGLRAANAQLGSAQRQLADEAGRIVSSLGAQLRAARSQEVDIKSQLNAAQSGAVQAENIRARLDQLQQDANGRRALYQTLMERAQQTASQPASQNLPDVRVLSPAVPPGLPSGPDTKLATAMGGLGGVLLGGLIALLRLRSVDGLESAGDVTFTTGLPVLASVPARVVARAATNAMPEAALAEAMRALRSRLRNSGRTGTPRSVLFVPAAPGAAAASAAATVAACFARVVAADGERVLIIEGDLQPEKGTVRLSDMMEAAGVAAGAFGLEDALHAPDWREAVVADRQLGLDLLLAPSLIGSSAQALLRSMQFQNLLVDAKEEYDLIVLDAPQAGLADAAALAQRCDAVVLMIDSRAGRPEAREAAHQLGSSTRTPLVAMLMTRA